MELTLFLDHQCNLRCTYCYTGRKFTRPMSSEVLRKALDLALSNAGPTLDVAFFGGEPLLRFDLMREAEEYVARATRGLVRPPSVRWLLNTNATLLTSETLDWLAPPRAAMTFVSLDGPRAVHDRCRVDTGGKGTYDRVLAAIRRLAEREARFRVLAVVSVESAAEVGQTLAELLRLGAEQIHLSANYRDSWDEHSIAQLHRGLAVAAEVYMGEFRAGRTPIVEPLHSKILAHLKAGIPCPRRCLLGGHEFAVAPSGRIYPCAQMVEEDEREDLVIGHVDTGLNLERIRRLVELKARAEATCSPCALRDRCQSHCGCRQLALTGELGKITAVLCELETAFIETADGAASSLYGEQCSAFLDFYYRRPWIAAPGAELTALRRARP